MYNLKSLCLKIFALVLVLQFNPIHTNAHSFNLGVIKSNLSINKHDLLISTEVNERIDLSGPDHQQQLQIAEEYFKGNLIIKNEGVTCNFKIDDFSYPELKKTLFKGSYACPSKVNDVADLQIHSTLFSDFFGSYEHFISITNKTKKTDIVLTQSEVDYPKITAHAEKAKQKKSQSNLSTVAKEFIKLGAVHIWKGYDHILFLIMLVLLLRSYKHILEVVTAFTIAHSITLIIVGMGIATISPRIVEPLIALTIVLVALRNIIIINKGEQNEHIQERWLIAAGFGLIHGLGFAGALKDLKIPSEQFLSSLIFFNVGVEIGQVVLLAIVIPVLLTIDKSKRRLGILENIAIIVAIQSSIWFFKRVFA